MPPTPICAVMWYTPILVPGARAKRLDYMGVGAFRRRLLRPDGDPASAVVVVGLAASDWRDWPSEAVALGARAALAVSYGHWEHSAPIVWPPPTTYREIKRLSRSLLPRCAVHPPSVGPLFANLDETGTVNASVGLGSVSRAADTTGA